MPGSERRRRHTAGANPNSGSEAADLARDAARGGTSIVVATGGDGTVNEVVRRLCRANPLHEVTRGVVPLGTGNNFTKNIGVTDVETAFAVVERGERRRIDLGRSSGAKGCPSGWTRAR